MNAINSTNQYAKPKEIKKDSAIKRKNEESETSNKKEEESYISKNKKIKN